MLQDNSTGAITTALQLHESVKATAEAKLPVSMQYAVQVADSNLNLGICNNQPEILSFIIFS